MNPDPKGPPAGANLIPPLAPSAYDGAGGSGGGGGGAVAIFSLGEIVITATGKILATGGRGGGGENMGSSIIGGAGGGGSGGAILLNSGTRITIEYIDEDLHGVLDVSGGWGGDAPMKEAGNANPIPSCRINLLTGTKTLPNHCSWSSSDGGCGSYGLIQMMVPDPTDPSQLEFSDESVEAMLCVIDGDPNYEKTDGETGFALYHMTSKGTGPGGTKPFVPVFPMTTDCLVPPELTPSDLSPQTYAVSKWIDTGTAKLRPALGGGQTVPLFRDFEGIVIDGDWGTVNTQNNYVVNAHIDDYNDIVVDAPDLILTDYIPETNEVAIQFQGTDAVVPGSKVPDPDPAKMTDWTADLSNLSGKQFVRYRIRFNVAKGTEVSPNNLKPQVSKVRLRFRF
jgi:hypothetical protein